MYNVLLFRCPLNVIIPKQAHILDMARIVRDTVPYNLALGEPCGITEVYNEGDYI